LTKRIIGCFAVNRTPDERAEQAMSSGDCVSGWFHPGTPIRNYRRSGCRPINNRLLNRASGFEPPHRMPKRERILERAAPKLPDQPAGWEKPASTIQAD
jgi:hypothetical protein